jgi:hypothetical protein
MKKTTDESSFLFDVAVQSSNIRAAKLT